MLSTANGSLSAFLGDYMRDLQLRHSYSDGSGCGASASASGEAGLTVHLPDSYKVRGRVGRGGRMVLDRIPVYHSATDSDRCYSDCHSDSQDHEQQQGMQQGIHGIAEECSRGSSSALAGYQGSTGGMRVVYGAVLHPSRQQSRAERDRDREKERESAHCMTVPTVPQARFTVHHSNMNILGGSGGNNCHHYYTASARTQTAQFRAKCADIYAYPHVDNECVVFAGSGAGVDAGASAGVQISHTFNRLLALPEGQIKGAPVPVTSPELALQYTLYV